MARLPQLLSSCLSSTRKLAPAFTRFIPVVFSILLFLAAAMLLFSSVTPSEPTRLLWVYKFMPLSIMEASHLLASISGIGLLFLSFTIRQRVDSAYYLTLAILCIGIFSSLLKGWEVEEATILTLLFLLFLPTKPYFYRRTRVLSTSLPLPAVILCSGLLAAVIWFGFFTYKRIAYSNNLWFHFSLHDDPSRFLRTLGSLLLIGVFLLLYRIVTRPYNGLFLPDAADIARAHALIQNAPESTTFLALMRDKYLFWSATGESFIMFGIKSPYWIAMGDPVGNPAEFPDLIWKFKEEADTHSARIAFYEVGAQHVSMYLDTGMSLMKIGEQARVNLTNFTLEGKSGQKLRQALNKGQKENWTFEVLKGEDIQAILPQLRDISTTWLKKKKTREKGFSLGRFDDAYLTYGHMALAKKDGKIFAFSNLFTPECKEEISLDLMRYGADAPGGIMEYLTINAILWGKAQGYHWFNLGMAPLAGLYSHPLSSSWHKIGHMVFRFGGEFYNFKGLYQYKNKFQPTWSSRYLACPGNLQATRVLLAVASLISRGLNGIFKA